MGQDCQILWPHKYNIKQLENQPKKQFFHGLEKKVFAQMDLFFIDHAVLSCFNFYRIKYQKIRKSFFPQNKRQLNLGEKICFSPKTSSI